jgi:hypothetical protein
MESGIRALDLSAGLAKGIRKATVVVEETKGSEESKEAELAELADPVVVERGPSTVAKRVVAQSRNRHTQQRERDERGGQPLDGGHRAVE